MPKIYWKTIGLVIVTIALALLRANELYQFFIFATPGDSNFTAFLDLGMFMAITALVINEKLTRGEHWKAGAYILLFAATLLFIFLRQEWILWSLPYI